MKTILWIEQHTFWKPKLSHFYVHGVGQCSLDLTITPSLKLQGKIRDFRRAYASWRKNHGLSIHDYWFRAFIRDRKNV